MGKAIEGLLGGEPKEAKEEAKKTRGWAKVNKGNRLLLKDVPEPLMDWLKTKAGETFRTPGGFAMFTLQGCMKANLKGKDGETQP